MRQESAGIVTLARERSRNNKDVVMIIRQIRGN